jgi:hypothetical protein
MSFKGFLNILKYWNRTRILPMLFVVTIVLLFLGQSITSLIPLIIATIVSAIIAIKYREG